jgi:hypothetical protein
MKTGLQGRQLIGPRLEQQQGLRCGLDLAPPAIDGLRGWDERGAGSEALFDESATQAGGLFSAGCGR